MSLDQVQYVNRTRCGFSPDSAEDCSPYWVSEIRAHDTESGLGDFDVKYCTRCKMGFTNPYPSEETSHHLYEERISGDFDRLGTSWVDRVKDEVARRLLRRISPVNDPARIRSFLDYACGNGRFAYVAAELFSSARVAAVDYQKTAPAILSPATQSRVQYVTVADFASTDERYDLIFLRHVLEHSFRPIELIRMLAARLETGGILYIEVPNLRAGGARIFRSRWKGYYVPRHIFHYTSESLSQILAAAGLVGKVEPSNAPWMGNTLADLLHVSKENRLIQLLGVLLHPAQLAIEFFYRSSSCLCVRASHPPAV